MNSNETNTIYDIAIIGAGAAGMMAALRGVLNNDSVLMIGGAAREKKRSRAQWVRKVENIPGFMNYKKGVLDPNKETLDFIENSAFKDNLTYLRNSSVTDLKKEDDLFTLTLDSDESQSHQARFVILATGVMDIQPQIEGSIKTIFPYANVQAVDYCVRCDGHHVHGKETVVIGGDESAAWIAIMLHERYAPPHLTVLTDGKTPEYSEKVKQLLELYKIEVNTKGIDGVRGKEKEGLLEGFLFCDGTIHPADFAFVSMGMMVYNELANRLETETDKRGFVVANPKGESSVDGLYVAGDLRANTKKQIYTAWDTAVDAADDINHRLRILRREEKLSQIVSQ